MFVERIHYEEHCVQSSFDDSARDLCVSADGTRLHSFDCQPNLIGKQAPCGARGDQAALLKVLSVEAREGDQVRLLAVVGDDCNAWRPHAFRVLHSHHPMYPRHLFRTRPDLPLVASFDTAFHASLRRNNRSNGRLGLVGCTTWSARFRFMAGGMGPPGARAGSGEAAPTRRRGPLEAGATWSRRGGVAVSLAVTVILISLRCPARRSGVRGSCPQCRAEAGGPGGAFGPPVFGT